MKSIKKIVFLFVLSIVLLPIQSQDIIKLIPKTTAIVWMTDLNQISSKASYNELIKLPFFEKADKEIAKELSRDIIKNDDSRYLDFSKYGINSNSKSYFYLSQNDKLFYGALVIAINDEAKFTQFAKLLTRDLDGERILQKENYKQTEKSELKIVWNNNSAAFFGASVNPAYRDSIENKIREELDKNDEKTGFEKIAPIEGTYEETVIEAIEEATEDIEVTENSEITEVEIESNNNVSEAEIETADTEVVIAENYNKKPYISAYSLAREACDSIENEWLLQNTANFLKDKGTNSLANNTDYQNYVKTNPDATMVLDYGLISNLYVPYIFGSYVFKRNRPTYQLIQDLYKGLKLYSKVEFNKDDVQFKMGVKHSGILKDIFKNVKKKKVSKNFLKYMNKDLMAYYALGVDIEGYADGIKDVVKNILPGIPDYGDIAALSIDLLEIAIDEEALYNIFSGDILLAFNGMKPVEVIHKSYDYDEDFKRTEKIDTSMQMQPELMLMVGVGNKSDVSKILNLLTKTKVLKKEGNLYTNAFGRSPLPVFLKMQNDILFVSNNKTWVKTPNIYAKNEQLSKDHQKLFKKNAAVAYANIEKITSYFAKDGSSKEKRMLAETANLFKDAKLYAHTKNDWSRAAYTIKLSESPENSIMDILKFMNILYEISETRL